MNIPGLSIWGDSIAKGIVYDESRGRYAICRDNCILKLSRNVDFSVENHSVMGQTSENGLERMQGSCLKPGHIAAIEYGGNDCDLDWKQVSEHPEIFQPGKVPLEQFGKNLAELVRRVREAGMHPVLVTPAPLISERYFNWVSRGLDKKTILAYLGDVDHIFRWQEDYAEKVRSVAKRMGVYLLDIRQKMLDSGRLEEMICLDGIHPNEKGHEFIYETVMPLLG